MSAGLPSSLRAAYVGAMVGAALIGCCAVYSGLGVALRLHLTPEGAFFDDEHGTVARMVALQRTLAIVSIITLALQLATSVGLAVGGGLGMSGRPIARPVMLTALGLVVLGVLLDGGVALWTWSSISELYGVPAGSRGSDERWRMAVAGMAPTACWMIVKLGLVAAAMGGMYSAEAKTFYARMGPEGLVRGPRE